MNEIEDIRLAFLALQEALNRIDVKTDPTEGSPYFTAYTEVDDYGNPCNGVFVHNRVGRPMFRWGMLTQHSMDDIPGAARRIRDHVEAQSISDRLDNRPAE